jgi:hypothetical protein
MNEQDRLDLNPMVAKVAAMDGEDREAFFAHRGPCRQCNLFRVWLFWSTSEPTSLQSFLWDLYEEHIDRAGEAAWEG